jgi:oxygen-dependent protoporphyrinogen oxidase
MVLVAPTRLRPFLTTRLLSPLGKARAACDLVLPARTGDTDETLAGFVSRRFGREVADRLAVPLLASVYGGGSGDLSLLASFPELRRLEQTHRSVLLGLRALDRQRGTAQAGSPFVTLRGGLHTLVDGLTASLCSTEIRCCAEVRRLALARGHGAEPAYHLELASGQTIGVDAVILATPADAASRILERPAPRAAASLAQISYLPALVVTVAFSRAGLAHPLQGTGFVVPAEEHSRLIACTWVSRKWPHASEPDAALLRCYLGGPNLADLLTREDPELVALACAELKGVLGIGSAPLLARVYRWPSGIPRYAVGHLECVRRAEQVLESLPGVVLAGAAYRGIGVPDCIRQGEEAARAVLIQARRPVPAT